MARTRKVAVKRPKRRDPNKLNKNPTPRTADAAAPAPTTGPKKVTIQEPTATPAPKRPEPKKYKVRTSPTEGGAARPSGDPIPQKRQPSRVDASKASVGGAGGRKRKAGEFVEFDSLPEEKRMKLAEEFRDVCVVVDREALGTAIVKQLYSGLEDIEVPPRVHAANVTFVAPKFHREACGKGPQEIFGQTVVCKTLSGRSEKYGVITMGNHMLMAALRQAWPHAATIKQLTSEAVRLRFQTSDEAQAVIDGGRKLVLGVPLTPRSFWGIAIP